MTVKYIKNVNVGDIVGITHNNLGSQWCIVESIEVGAEKTKITVKFPKHVGSVSVTKNYKNDKRVNWQTREAFDSWCRVNRLSPF